MTKPLSKMSRSELVDACIKEQQRSADLAAHVEACQPIIEAYADAAFFDRGCEDAKEDAKKLRNMKPTTSLGRLIAEKQAEALEKLGPGLVDIIDRSQAKRMAAELRRQAEEPTNGHN